MSLHARIQRGPLRLPRKGCWRMLSDLWSGRAPIWPSSPLAPVGSPPRGWPRRSSPLHAVPYRGESSLLAKAAETGAKMIYIATKPDSLMGIMREPQSRRWRRGCPRITLPRVDSMPRTYCNP